MESVARDGVKNERKLAILRNNGYKCVTKRGDNVICHHHSFVPSSRRKRLRSAVSNRRFKNNMAP